MNLEALPTLGDTAVSLGPLAEFLLDPRPQVRSAALRALGTQPGEEAVFALVRGVFDEAREVRMAASAALKHRDPWLILRPTPVRPVPDLVLRSERGRRWQTLRLAISAAWRDLGPLRFSEVLDRWSELPALQPDVVELGLAEGRLRELPIGDPVERAIDPDDSAQRQIILCPTYRCNLSCSYCYAKEWGRHYPEDLSLDDLRRVMVWLGDNRVNLLILGGGEPTEYRHLPELLEEARRREMRVILTTNTLYSRTVAGRLDPSSVFQLVTHYDQDRLQSSAQAESRYLDNLERARAAGIPLQMRFTLDDRSTPEVWRPAMDVAHRFGIDTFGFAFSFENSDRSNRFVHLSPVDGASTLVNALLALAEDAEAHGMQLYLCKPLPLCALPDSALRSLLERGALRSACTATLRAFSKNLTVNPDLSTFPCTAVREPGPRLLDFASLDEAGAHFRAFFESLLDQPPDSACEDCLFFFRGLCQCECLVTRTHNRTHVTSSLP